MTILLVSIHVVVSLLLMLVVLIQQGKGADLAGAFGGGGSQMAFGARSATTFLQKSTAARQFGKQTWTKVRTTCRKRSFSCKKRLP